MTGRNDAFRLYSDLAWLWPMWGDPATEYAHYCDHIVRMIEKDAKRPVHTLLDIGCGGGKNIYNLKNHYKVSGLDLSPVMLEQARELNPECEFLKGDMRTFSLDRKFDAILLDDGISHMTSRADLSAAFQTAFRHLNPGGVMITGPDVTAENFQQNRTTATPAGDKAGPENIDVVFIENVFDPDPADEHYEATILYLIRENGILRVERDRCILGLFSQETWQKTLREAGFSIRSEKYAADEDEYTIFVCVKPAVP